MSKRLLVVWWSTTGGTRQLVGALREGAAQQADVELVVRRADQAGPADVLAAVGTVARALQPVAGSTRPGVRPALRVNCST